MNPLIKITDIKDYSKGNYYVRIYSGDPYKGKQNYLTWKKAIMIVETDAHNLHNLVVAQDRRGIFNQKNRKFDIIETSSSLDELLFAKSIDDVLVARTILDETIKKQRK